MPVSTAAAAGPLATAADLTQYGTFSDDLVADVGEAVRSETGWHIAPKITETLTLDGDGSYVLMLPTLKVDAIVEVRDVTAADPRVITGWRRSANGYLTLTDGYWPTGPGAVEVDLTHGYETCPVDLLPVLAHRLQAMRVTGLSNVRLGSLSVGSGAAEDSTQDTAAVGRYTL